MSPLIALIKALIPAAKHPKDLDEAYLCPSASGYELARRMKDIDLNARKPAGHLIDGNTMP